MNIGIIGSGNIGATLARRFAAAGHQVKLANSRGPDSIRDLAREIGVTAVSPEAAVKDVDTIILSIPFAKVPDLAPLFADVPGDVVVIDTSNYYPHRDGVIAEVEGGQVESLWVSEQLKRPVTKAWNAVWTATLAEKALPRGAPGRLAIPVAGDDDRAKATAMALVDTAGFDALDAGSLAGSWRQQFGTPSYCTELALDDLKAALASADKARAPNNRDELSRQFRKWTGAETHDEIVTLFRTVSAQ